LFAGETSAWGAARLVEREEMPNQNPGKRGRSRDPRHHRGNDRAALGSYTGAGVWESNRGLPAPKNLCGLESGSISRAGRPFGRARVSLDAGAQPTVRNELVGSAPGYGFCSRWAVPALSFPSGAGSLHESEPRRPSKTTAPWAVWRSSAPAARRVARSSPRMLRHVESALGAPQADRPWMPIKDSRSRQVKLAC